MEPLPTQLLPPIHYPSIILTQIPVNTATRRLTRASTVRTSLQAFVQEPIHQQRCRYNKIPKQALLTRIWNSSQVKSHKQNLNHAYHTSLLYIHPHTSWWKRSSPTFSSHDPEVTLILGPNRVPIRTQLVLLVPLWKQVRVLRRKDQLQLIPIPLSYTGRRHLSRGGCPNLSVHNLPRGNSNRVIDVSCLEIQLQLPMSWGIVPVVMVVSRHKNCFPGKMARVG